MNVNIKNMPHYLKESDVQDWLERARKLIEGLLNVHSEARKLNVEFSKRLRVKNWNLSGRSLDDVKKELRKLYPKAGIDAILDDITSEAGYWNSEREFSLRRRLAERIAQCSGLPVEVVQRDLDDMFSNVKSTSVLIPTRLLGEYFPIEHKIVLYVDAIEETAAGKRIENSLMDAMLTFDATSLFEEVFAHEFFHFVHYGFAETYLSDVLLTRIDYTSTVVKESLASYFESEYVKQYIREPYTLDLQKIWHENSAVNYPYSGARYVHDEWQFARVFQESLNDMDNALDVLIDQRRDEPIKFAIRRKSKTYASRAVAVAPTMDVESDDAQDGEVTHKRIAPYDIVYLPGNEAELVKKLETDHEYTTIVFYKNGEVEQITRTSDRILSLKQLRANVNSQKPTRRDNPRMDEIRLAVVIAGKLDWTLLGAPKNLHFHIELK